LRCLLDAGRGRRSLREEITNLPNMLTLARIALIPPVVWLMLLETPAARFVAALLFGLAAATDWLDGYLARKQGKVSVLGKLLDPMADKLLIMTALIMLVACPEGSVPDRENGARSRRPPAGSSGCRRDRGPRPRAPPRPDCRRS